MLKAGRLSVQSLADSFYNVGEDDITLPAAEKLHWVKKVQEVALKKRKNMY